MPEKEQIQALISEGLTEEALAILVKLNSDALLLQAQFNNGKKQFNLGLIEFSEWQRIQARVNYAALEMAGKKAGTTGNGSQPAAGPNIAEPLNGASRRKVFISYNHDDAEVARRVRTFFEAQGLDVLIDEDDLPPGMSIMEFIQNSIKGSDAVVSIVSAKSLASGWVGQESVASVYAVWLADKKFIPVRLDNVAFDIDFQLSAQEGIQMKLKDLEDKIKRLRKLGGDSRAFDDDRNRLFELRNNLGQILQRLKSVNLLDISGANFEPNMNRVLEVIRKN